MADLGSARHISAPTPRGLADILTVVWSALAYPVAVTGVPGPGPIPAVGHYRLAGTQQLGAGYVIPSVGQLWPRGARGEIMG